MDKLADSTIESILHAEWGDAFSVLGMHKAGGLVQVRAFLPDCETVCVVGRSSGDRWPMHKVADEGLFAVSISEQTEPFSYELECVNQNGTHRLRDPYSFWPMVSEEDCFLFNEGKQQGAHRFLGAHFKTV